MELEENGLARPLHLRVNSLIGIINFTYVFAFINGPTEKADVFKLSLVRTIVRFHCRRLYTVHYGFIRCHNLLP
jgi:hypothetical protein